MMLEVGDLDNHKKARRMKVGGHNIMNQLASQGVVKSTFVGKWKQDLQVMAMHGGGIHEHGEWEVVTGSQTKVLRLVGVRGLGL